MKSLYTGQNQTQGNNQDTYIKSEALLVLVALISGTHMAYIEPRIQAIIDSIKGKRFVSSDAFEVKELVEYATNTLLNQLSSEEFNKFVEFLCTNYGKASVRNNTVHQTGPGNKYGTGRGNTQSNHGYQTALDVLDNIYGVNNLIMKINEFINNNKLTPLKTSDNNRMKQLYTKIKETIPEIKHILLNDADVTNLLNRFTQVVR